MVDPIAIDETDRLIASDKVEGTKVYNRKGEKLGTVANFMVGKRSGKVEYAVMEFGGLFGIGSEYYPIPWDLLDYEESEHGYVVDLDKDKLEGAPTIRQHDTVWDHMYGQQIHGFYGLAYPYM